MSAACAGACSSAQARSLRKALIYVDSLPEGVEQQDELTQKLRSIATAALEGRIDLNE